jgi:hypothetical protein
MKGKLFASLPEPARRRFLSQASILLAAPMVTDAFRYAFWEEVGGAAFADDRLTGPLFFLEVNFRDQWDFGPALVAPGVAAAVGRSNDLAVLGNPIRINDNFYLSPDALALRDHADSVAIIETGEHCIGGIHHHEAGNAMRSPGRSYTRGPGRTDMATVDKRPGTGGNEELYSSSPTPAVLHNHATRQAAPSLRKGVLIRSWLRSGTHTFYHFEANLGDDARLERFYDRDTLLKAFAPPPSMQSANVLSEHSASLTSILKRLDARYLTDLQKAKKLPSHEASLGRVDFARAADSLDVRLSGGDLSAWSQGIP